MSTITYKCSTCKREISKLENIRGLTVFSKCIITDGCRGNLYRIGRDPNNIREVFPPAMSGVKDFTPRKSLYIHTQEVNATEWRIYHGLSTIPSISVYEINDGAAVEIGHEGYSIRVLDRDSLAITFPTPKYGTVHCIAKSSVPPKPKVITGDIKYSQTSTQGNLVFAVPEFITQTDTTFPVRFNTADTVVRVQLEAIRPNEDPIICFEELDGDLNSTPWVGWDTILVRNRRTYNLKAKKLSEFRTFIGAPIPNGTLIKFTGIDYGDGHLRSPGSEYTPIPSRGLVSLLASPPYESVDKIKDSIVDVGELVKSKHQYFVYRDGELYTAEGNVESTYPDITDVDVIRGPKPTPSQTPSSTVPPTPTSTPTPTATPTITPSTTTTPTPSPTITITPTPSHN